MSQQVPGGGLPPLSSDQIRDMLKGPQLQRPLDTRPGQCTKDDPQGVAHNGTQGRVRTEYVTSRDPADDKKARENMERLQMCLASPFGCGPAIGEAHGLEIQSAKGSIEWGPFKVGGDTEKGPSGGLKGPGEKKKYSLKPKIKGEVCIAKKSDPKAKNGKWGNLEIKAGFISSKFGLGGGNLCYGFDPGKTFSWDDWDISYEPPG